MMIVTNWKISAVFGLISLVAVLFAWHLYMENRSAIENSICPDPEERDPINMIFSLITYPILTWLILVHFLALIVPRFEVWFGAFWTATGLPFGASLFVVGVAVHVTYLVLTLICKKAIELRDDEYVQCLVVGCITFCLVNLLDKEGGEEAQAAMRMMGMQTLAILLGKYVWLDGIITVKRAIKKLKELKNLLAQGTLFPIQESELIRGVAWVILFAFLIGLTLQREWFLAIELGTIVGGFAGLFILFGYLQLKENQRMKKQKQSH